MVASMTYEAERLVACPFCGGKAYLANPEPNALWRVICTKTCSAGEFVSNRTAAIAAWNTRSDAGHAAGCAGAIADSAPVSLCEHPDITAMRLIDKLRSAEGDCVTIVCDNPGDFDSSYNNAIECNGGWTDYQDRRFTGESVLQCLARAVMALEADQLDDSAPPAIEGMGG
jgi:hypothetical protein